MTKCSRVKLSLCRGQVGEAEAITIIAEGLMVIKDKLNFSLEEATVDIKEEEGEVSICHSISNQCKLGSVVAMPTSMLRKTLVQISLT